MLDPPGVVGPLMALYGSTACRFGVLYLAIHSHISPSSKRLSSSIHVPRILSSLSTASACTTFSAILAARTTIPRSDISGSYRPALHNLSLIHISEPTRLGMISYAVF